MNVERFGPEHRALADAKLRQAIEYHAEAYQLDRDDEMLNVFGVIAHWTTAEEDGLSRYTTHFHVPTVPGYVARGLFGTALHIVDDDDE